MLWALGVSPRAGDAAVDEAVDPRSGWTWDDLRGAAMLHSEAALGALRLQDEHTADSQLRLAERLLERTVRLRPAQRDFAWRWYIVVPRLIAAFGAPDIVRHLDDRRRAIWRGDTAREHYVRALRLETQGTRMRRVLEPGEPSTHAEELDASSFFAAAQEYREALTADRSLPEPRCTSGGSEWCKASARRRRRSSEPRWPSPIQRWSTSASLFLGSLEEREGRLTAAETLYRDALDRLPYGQAAPLALAELLSRAGRDSQARDVITAYWTRSRLAVIEPMSAYGSFDDQPGPHFDLLRMEVFK